MTGFTPGAARRRLPGSPLSALDGLVLELIAIGWTNFMIGTALGMTPRTAKGHVERLQQKLQARNRAHIVAQACRTGRMPNFPESGP